MTHKDQECNICKSEGETIYFIEFANMPFDTLFLCEDCCGQLSNEDMDNINGKEVGIYSCNEDCAICN